MNKKIVAVCESERSLNSLKTAANDLGFDLVYEIQENDNIKNELSIYDIEDASIVLFVTSDSIESIEKIDRFIDREFYEVDPKYILVAFKVKYKFNHVEITELHLLNDCTLMYNLSKSLYYQMQSLSCYGG